VDVFKSSYFKRGAFLFLLLSLTGCGEGVSLQLHNRSGYDISSIRVDYSGGASYFDELKEGKKEKILINASDDSSIMITLVGLKEKQDLDVYIGKGYKGDIKTEIGKDLKVIVLENNIAH
jgi:hypothetical protein